MNLGKETRPKLPELADTEVDLREWLDLPALRKLFDGLAKSLPGFFFVLTDAWGSSVITAGETAVRGYGSGAREVLAQVPLLDAHTRLGELQVLGEPNPTQSEGPNAAAFAGYLADFIVGLVQREHLQRNALTAMAAGVDARVAQRTSDLALVNQELERFAHTLAHDLQAPLRGIKGWNQAILDDYGATLNLEVSTMLRTIREEVQRMERMVEALLQLGLLGRREVRRERVDLGDLAVDVVLELRQSEPSRWIEVDIAAGMIVEGDAGLLGALVQNLLANAWKFTSTKERAHISFTPLASSERTPCFVVKDDGIGFDMEYVQKLFVPFKRLHGPESFPGTGIGLATAKRVVTMHGGRIWAEGTPGTGAAFFFTLAPEGTRTGEEAPPGVITEMSA